MKIAIVTGASSGMGREFLLRIDKEYKLDQIWAIARNKERLDQLQNWATTPIRTFSLDLTDPASIDVIAAALGEEQPWVQLLINCSGFGKFGTFESIDQRDNTGMIDLNCRSYVAMTQTVLPYMNRRGIILNVDSMSAFMPLPHVAIYAATKAFVLSWSRALNVELRPRGIRSIAFCPYWVMTSFFDRANDKQDIQHFDKVYTTEFVVGKAMTYMRRKKGDTCVPGLYAKLLHLTSRIMPKRFVMWVWTRSQKLDRRDRHAQES